MTLGASTSSSRRRLTVKTDTKSDDVLMPSGNRRFGPAEHGEYTLSSTMRPVTKRIHGVTNRREGKSRQSSTDPREVKKGRQKDLNSLKNGCHDSSETIRNCWQTCNSNAMCRSRKRRLREAQAGSEGVQSRPRAYSARDVCTDTIYTVSENFLAAVSHDRNNHPERHFIAIAIDVHTGFLHAGIDQEKSAEPPEVCVKRRSLETAQSVVWALQSTETVAQTYSFESLNYHHSSVSWNVCIAIHF